MSTRASMSTTSCLRCGGEEIRTQLDIGGLLGADRREQLMLEAIDKYLAREADALADNTEERLSTELAERLAAILDGSGEAG
jgi:hypothetical protein